MKYSLPGLVLLPGLFLASPAAAQLAGPWVVAGSISGTPFTVNCQFQPKTAGFGGVCIDATNGKTHVLSQGDAAGNHVQWSYPAHFMMMSFTVNFSGTLNGDHMAGTVSASGRTGAFSATRK